MSAVQRAARPPIVWSEYRPPPPRNNPEEKLQAQVMEFLALALPHGAVAHHSPGEGLRSKRAQGELKRSGHQKGWPDIEIVWRGRIYFIELKVPGSYPSAAQREMHKRLLFAEAPVMLCRSLAEVEAQLREATIPLRALVTVSRGAPWSEADVRLLREHHAAGLRAGVVAKRLERSVTAIREKARSLGLRWRPPRLPHAGTLADEIEAARRERATAPLFRPGSRL